MKTVVTNVSDVGVFSIPGITHQTVAGKGIGGVTIEMWKQTVAPGAATPPHFHGCEEVIYVLEGSGELRLNEETIAFAAECTLTVTPREVHQIVNTGTRDLKMIAVMDESPARVFLPTGERLPLPWET
jgi:quercetin dioxygenase-like cupin family protein